MVQSMGVPAKSYQPFCRCHDATSDYVARARPWDDQGEGTL